MYTMSTPGVRIRAAVLACCVAVLAAARAAAYSSGAATCSYPNAGWTDMGGGAPGNGGFTVEVRDEIGPVTHYGPGKQYTVTIANAVGYPGFLLQCVKGMPGVPNQNGVGTFSWSTSIYQHGPCFNDVSSVTHTSDRAAMKLSTDSFTWTAPDVGTGPVTFHMVGVISRFAWYGYDALIINSLLEGPATPVSSPTWSSIKALYWREPVHASR